MRADYVSHPLIVNLLRPDRVEETIRRQAEQQIAQRRRIKDRGVQNGRENWHALLVQLELPGLGSNGSQSFFAPAVRLFSVSQEVGQTDSPVTADHAIGNLAAIKQSDQVSPGDIKEMGSLMRAQFAPDVDQSDGIALG